jgi:thiamine kinase-like enzyme
MARLLRRVHALPIPEPARIMGPAAWIDRYSASLARQTSEWPACQMKTRMSGPKAVALRSAAFSRLARLAASGSRTSARVLCHGDLHRLNVASSDHPVLFDWEFAHVTDPYWDLAGWIANNGWTERPAGELLSSYLQRKPELVEAMRLAQLVWLYDYVCLLWSQLYLAQPRGATSAEVAAQAEALEARLSERLSPSERI